MQTLPPSSCKVYTPLRLAKAIATTLGDFKNVKWLEPCFGQGAFIQSLSGLGVDKHRITAVDLDLAPHHNDRLAMTIRGTDFVCWSHRTQKRFDRIVGNPPFVALSALPPTLKEAACGVMDFDGGILPKTSNYWYVFLVSMLKLLNRGAGIGLVLPSSFEYADYASRLREKLPLKFDHMEIHRCLKPMFKPVQEGSIVLIAKGFGNANTACIRKEHADIDDLIAAVCADRLVDQAVRGAGKDRSILRIDSSDACKFGDICKVLIGGVTGDARYFLMSESERRMRRIPVSACVPVLSRSRHLRWSSMTIRRWQYLRDRDERVWLFRPKGKALQNVNVKRYMNLRPSLGGCHKKRYKIQTRETWYCTSLPRTIHGFISGMSHCGPWITFCADSKVKATNTLYVVEFKEGIGKERQWAWALGLLTTYARSQIHERCRRYADGLAKFEPRDLLAIRVPKVETSKGAAHAYRLSVKALLQRDFKKSAAIADNFFRGLTLPD